MPIKYTYDTYDRIIEGTAKELEDYASDPVYSSKEYNKYDPEHFDSLVRQYRYEEAYEYGSQFKLHDVEANRQRDLELLNMRNQGRIMSSIRANASDEDKEALDFNMNVYSDGGLENINPNNTYLREFTENKRLLGGENATTLEFIFAPEKRKFLGIDWLAIDNHNNIDRFYERSGLTKEMLEKAGVNVSEKDGSTSLKFDKSNKYANYIIGNLKDVYSPYDLAVKYGSQGSTEFLTKMVSYDSDGKEITSRQQPYYQLYNMKKILRETSQISEKYSEPLKISKVYSSTVGKFISDAHEELNQQYRTGKIDRATYKMLLEQNFSNELGVLRSLGSQSVEIYSNAYNDVNTDATLVGLDNTQRQWAINEITSADDFSLNSMTSNGKIGTLITIYAEPEDKKNLNKDSNSEESVRTIRHQFFIPGLFHEKAQAAINADTNTRAKQELNNMQDYGYDYKLANGSKLRHKGGYIYDLDGREVDINVAENLLAKQFLYEDAKHNLKYQYIDGSGKLNKQLYSNMLKVYTTNAINELNSIPLRTMDGQELDLNTIFAIKGIGSVVSSNYIGTINTDVNKKLQEIYQLYDLLMDDANKF